MATENKRGVFMNSQMRVPLIAGNWKMYKTVSEAKSLVQSILSSCAHVKGREILVCPPFSALFAIGILLNGSQVKLGAQNLFWESQGAFTGEVSGPMLKDLGCSYVIVGHSERRQYFSETDSTVNKRMKAAFLHGLIPIVCVGETLQEREDGALYTVVETQVRDGISGLSPEQASHVVVAYEPVWAIGTGRTATPLQAQEMHAFIRKILNNIYGENISRKIRILYGGSVKPENIDDLMAQGDIDGGLVGGASLKAEDFSRIVQFK